MGWRDRFFTPTTASAIMSWRILIGIGVGAAMAVAGLSIGVAIGVGAAVYAATVAAAMPRAPATPAIDAFTLSEPWRQIVQAAQASSRKLRDTVDGADDGPLKQTLVDIARELDRGLGEAWQVARRGDEIDDAVRRLDPTALRSKIDTLWSRGGDDPPADVAAAIASTERQLATAERLKAQSAETADALRLAQTHLDELVAKASEVRIGAVETDGYRREVDDLVIRLEALHQAVEETRTA